ncbi:Uncharacterised protein [Mycobacterium tuberculosis]|nr:Uncharacterised protein [Mycobacterium tuberculosis]
MKRSADCTWRCEGATSPGMMSCRPAYSDCVIDELPGSAGFSSTSTRRTASSAVMRSADSISSGRISS